MKKIILLFLAFAIAFSFVGCVGDSDKNGGGDNSNITDTEGDNTENGGDNKEENDKDNTEDNGKNDSQKPGGEVHFPSVDL